MPSYRPRTNLDSPKVSRNGLVMLAVIAAIALIGLGAGASDSDPDPRAALEQPEGGDEGHESSDEPDTDAEEAADEPEASAGEAEGAADAAQFALPSFDALKPLPAHLDYLARAKTVDGRLVVASKEGERPLTIDRALQQKTTALLKGFAMPYGAIAAIEPSTGRVLALAEFSAANPEMRGLPLKAVYPAASVFKIVTGAALLEAGTAADENVCFHGGKRRLNPKLLVDDARRDHRCSTLSDAMGHSTNVVFAKLASRTLDASKLRTWAERFGFNSPLSFPQPVDVSVARIPEESFGMANAAAGFGETFLSPLHGATLAAAVANKGVLMNPVLFEGEFSRPRRVLSERTAASLAEMLETTVTSGTARRAFRERGRYALGPARAAGKTGSLSDKNPFRDYSWFVGWAPLDNPRIAVAAVVVNGSLWRVRAPYLARETMRMYLEGAPDGKRVAEPAKPRSSGRRRHRGR